MTLAGQMNFVQTSMLKSSRSKHSGVRGNEIADLLAVDAARSDIACYLRFSR